ncbi:MAG: universal stress protein [Anaerolineae bacterium]|nr:universal stress protein [Anaerolineae bacterium]
MYKNILVPLDGSKRAEAVLPHVEYLARKTGAKVIFMRVVETEPMLVAAEPVYTTYAMENHLYRSKEAETYLTALCGEFREKDIETGHFITHAGPIIDEIVDAAEREKVDLIAMTSHGRTGLARVLFGSVAAGILHRVDNNIPLLIIRSLEGD